MKVPDAQKVIDTLCAKYGLPPIRVKEVEAFEAGTLAQFDPNNYIVEVSTMTERHDVFHEFAHYMERLLKVVPPLEEDLCNAFADAIDGELISPTEVTPAAET